MSRGGVSTCSNHITRGSASREVSTHAGIASSHPPVAGGVVVNVSIMIEDLVGQQRGRHIGRRPEGPASRIEARPHEHTTSGLYEPGAVGLAVFWCSCGEVEVAERDFE